MGFIPDDQQIADFDIPYFEEARKDIAPFYSSTRTVKEAEEIVATGLARLGAGAIEFVAGKFEGKPIRYGYQVRFVLGGAKGLIEVACLPLRKFSTTKLNKARVQALLIVGSWLSAAQSNKVFAPGGNPLVPYLLVDGQTTLSQYLEALGEDLGNYLRSPADAPRLEAGETLEGEFEVE